MKKITFAFLVIIGLFLLAWGLRPKNKNFSALPDTPHVKAQTWNKTSNTQAQNGQIALPSPPHTPPPTQRVGLSHNSNSQYSLTTMNKILKHFALTQHRLADIIARLDALHMNPVLHRDQNPYTGTMYVLRTDSPLPGTRYFHAQYFSDEKQVPFLQHMSFDIPPQKNGFQKTIQAIKATFGKLPRPAIVKKDFIMWPWKKGYNIWIQQLNKEQVSSDPFNAYDETDIGSIKVAVELDVEH